MYKTAGVAAQLHWWTDLLHCQECKTRRLFFFFPLISLSLDSSSERANIVSLSCCRCKNCRSWFKRWTSNSQCQKGVTEWLLQSTLRLLLLMFGPYQRPAASEPPLLCYDDRYQAAKLRGQMWAGAQPEILGPIAPPLWKQIQYFFPFGIGALTGQRGKKKGGKRKKETWISLKQCNSVSFLSSLCWSFVSQQFCMCLCIIKHYFKAT